MAEIKKLYLSNSNKKLGGVCGGLEKFLKFDATLIRLIFVGTIFLGGFGLLLYILMWIFVPRDPNPNT